MSIRTACIRACPKPDYIGIGNVAEQEGGHTRAFTGTRDLAALPPGALLRAAAARPTKIAPPGERHAR